MLIRKGVILVVDDEETMRKSLADILRLEGYRVQTVASGTAALNILKRETFDLMLLDLKMPGMDGLEVLNQAAKISPDTKVIMLTAHGSLESAIEALRKETHDYLLKPSSPKQILSSVASALARSAEAKNKRRLLDQLDSSLRELKGTEMRESRLGVDQGNIHVGGGVYLNLARREIWQLGCEDSNKISLTPTEGKLLQVFVENQGKVFTHRELVALVQGYDVTDWEAPEVLRPLISRLRQKLAYFKNGDKWVGNVRGTGYIFSYEMD
jgi:DNA-binding response OmpR family regulator